MPAISEAQQRFMGMALAAKRGKGSFSKKVMEATESMSEKQLRDFAKTKHSGLPEKKAYIEGFMKRAAEYGYSESEISEATKTAGMLTKIKEYMKKHEDEPSKSLLKGFVKKQKEGLPALLKMRRLDRMRELGRQMDEK